MGWMCCLIQLLLAYITASSPSTTIAAIAANAVNECIA